MTKLEELRDLMRHARIMLELATECRERLQLLTPGGLEAYAIETERKVAELELLQRESAEKWAEWQEKYPNG
jgi:hypothetical protein